MSEQATHFQRHVSEVEKAPVKLEDGWRDMDIRFMVTGEDAGARHVCWWRTVFPPGAAHERHYHPNAEEEHEIGPGSAQFIPAGTVHWLRNADPDEELEIVGCYAGAASLEQAGYVFVSPVTDEYRSVE
jgi:quercetin dioxygenase-like cupin family protein